jgi:uncharacterized OB-fold protein
MTKPVPVATPLSQPFWEAASRGELRMQRCDDCGHIRFPIGPACTKCLSPRSTWTEVSRHGTVLSHLVFHRGYTADWRGEVPYSVVMLQLPEGPRMFLDVVDPEKSFVDRDLVGQQVIVTFDQMGDGVGVPRAVCEAVMQGADT